MPLAVQSLSKRKPVEWEVLNKFSHIFNENDRKVIMDSHMQSFGIENIEVKRKSKVVDQAKKLIIKNGD